MDGSLSYFAAYDYVSYPTPGHAFLPLLTEQMLSRGLLTSWQGNANGLGDGRLERNLVESGSAGCAGLSYVRLYCVRQRKPLAYGCSFPAEDIEFSW